MSQRSLATGTATSGKLHQGTFIVLIARENGGKRRATEATSPFSYTDQRRPTLGRKGMFSRAGKGKKSRELDLTAARNVFLSGRRRVACIVGFLARFVTAVNACSGTKRGATANSCGSSEPRVERNAVQFTLGGIADIFCRLSQ